MSMRIVNPKNGESITSQFQSHEAASVALKKRIADGEFVDNTFANSIGGFSGDASKRSAAQLFWLHKLANQGAKRPEGKAVAKVNLTPIKTMLLHAKEAGLKYPSIAVTVGDREVKLSLAGEKSANPNCVYLASFGRGGPYYGKITAEGNVFAGRDFTDELGEALHSMALDPLGFALDQGNLTGNCCFCRKQLTTDKSTALGYGPTCAKRFGLAHTKAAADEKKPSITAQVNMDLGDQPVRRITRRKVVTP